MSPQGLSPSLRAVLARLRAFVEKGGNALRYIRPIDKEPLVDNDYAEAEQRTPAALPATTLASIEHRSAAIPMTRATGSAAIGAYVAEWQPDRGPNKIRTTEFLDMVRQLPLMTREAFLLHRRDGMSYREIARQLAISVEDVEKLIAEALIGLDRMAIERQAKGPGSVRRERCRWPRSPNGSKRVV